MHKSRNRKQIKISKYISLGNQRQIGRHCYTHWPSPFFSGGVAKMRDKCVPAHLLIFTIDLWARMECISESLNWMFSKK